MMPTDLERPYSVLVDTVRSFELRGKTCLGAHLKPEFLRALGGGITERTLGFRRFGDFLRAAQSAGKIKIRVHFGGDIEVGLPQEPGFSQLSIAGMERPAAAANPTGNPIDSGQSLRVRPDLWRAFNAPTSNWYFDKVRDLAIRQTESQYRDSISILVPIPSARPRLSIWMRSFADLQESPSRTSLVEMLSVETNPYAFELQLKRMPGLLRAWRRFHVHQVLSEIEVWASANHVHPRDVAVPFTGTHLARNEAQRETAPAGLLIGERGIAPPEVNEVASDFLESRLPPLIDGLIEQLLMLRGLLAVKR